MNRNLINFVAFQIGWFSSVVGAGRGWMFLGPAVVFAIVVFHLVRSHEPVRELKFLVVVALLGTAVDSLFAASGLVAYRGSHAIAWIAPAWITAMWANFGTTIRASLGWLAKSYSLAAVFGAVGGPLTYSAAARLGAAELNESWWGLAALGLAWGIVLPFLFWLSRTKVFVRQPFKATLQDS